MKIKWINLISDAEGSLNPRQYVRHIPGNLEYAAVCEKPELSKKTNIVVLTDPDSPGKRIRDVLDQNIPGLFHAFIPKEKAIKGHKVGVAECDKETILEALNNAMPPLKEKTEGSLTMKDLFELGIVGNIDSSIKRDLLGQKFHVGYCNGKTILKRLNALEITKEDLRKALHE